jgi:acyl-CoA synthetase (AMP-forming)/AMP-acid ligase II
VEALTIPALLDQFSGRHTEDIFLVLLLLLPSLLTIVQNHSHFVQLGHDQQFREQSVTFGQFHKRVLLAALHLREEGVKKGSRCAFLVDTSVTAIVNIIAVISLGAVAVLVNRQTPDRVLDEVLKRFVSVHESSSIHLLCFSCGVTFLYFESRTDKIPLIAGVGVKVIGPQPHCMSSFLTSFLFSRNVFLTNNLSQPRVPML